MPARSVLASMSHQGQSLAQSLAQAALSQSGFSQTGPWHVHSLDLASSPLLITTYHHTCQATAHDASDKNARLLRARSVQLSHLQFYVLVLHPLICLHTPYLPTYAASGADT